MAVSTNPLDNSQEFGAVSPPVPQTYTVVSALSLAALIGQVNQMKQQGWYETGGVAISAGMFCQALSND